jgi:hypothetical protein
MLRSLAECSHGNVLKPNDVFSTVRDHQGCGVPCPGQPPAVSTTPSPCAGVPRAVGRSPGPGTPVGLDGGGQWVGDCHARRPEEYSRGRCQQGVGPIFPAVGRSHPLALLGKGQTHCLADLAKPSRYARPRDVLKKKRAYRARSFARSPCWPAAGRLRSGGMGPSYRALFRAIRWTPSGKSRLPSYEARCHDRLRRD